MASAPVCWFQCDGVVAPGTQALQHAHLEGAARALGAAMETAGAATQQWRRGLASVSRGMDGAHG